MLSKLGITAIVLITAISLIALVLTNQNPQTDISSSNQQKVLAIQEFYQPLGSPQDVGTIVDHAKDARFVLLGESSHGTREYYSMRAEISKQLIQNHGFKAILVEADWPYMFGTNQYVKFGSADGALEALRANARWPEWMWANPEFLELVEWAHQYNRPLPDSQKIGIYGMDVQNPTLALEVLETISSQPTGKDNREYAPATRQQAQLAYSLSLQYMRAIENNANSWNVRVRGMKQLIEATANSYDGPVIIWAHNTHVGDARATDMIQQESFNIGQLLRQKYLQQNVYSLGFGTYTGTVSASLVWGEPKQILRIPPATEGSLEHILNLAGSPLFFLDLRSEKIASLFTGVSPHRAKGVVYDPDRETMNYIPTVLPRRYDGFVFFAETNYLESLFE
jgi:erythromycin esterase